jgi:hypothetical protein
MPKQHTLFGRPIPPLTPRRVAQLLGSIAVFALVTLFFTLPTSVPGPSLSKVTDGHGFSLPKLTAFHPFHPAAHAPPVQENSTSGDASWYSNWNWLSPFSSSVTLDENRSLLPPLRDRPAIYTYYDHTLKTDADRKAADSEILLTWRKAWWAHGFKPIILGPQDAMNNPLYEEMQKLQLKSETQAELDIQAELSRWFAWERMGGGVLCHYLALPMGSYEDSLLSSLRRGEYPKLNRYEGLASGLFSGGKAEINAALKAALASKELPKSKDLIAVMPKDTFTVDPAPEAIAFYDSGTVSSRYAKIGEVILESPPKGLKQLNQLMNSHLHNTWQNVFSDGIAVLKPLPAHMTAVIEPALELAQFLAQCPESPMPASCPPNVGEKCKSCVASTPLKITTPAQYRNVSSKYTIGTLPHPYTLISLNALKETIDVPYIRRETARDQYLTTATKELLGTGVSTAPRLVKFKEAVASPYGAAHSIWFIAEKSLPTDLDWHFGFAVPRTTLDAGKSETPVPGPERRPPPPPADPQDGPVPNEKDLPLEKQLLEMAKMFLKSKKAEQKSLREAVEAWNLGDIEAWRFARAFLSRSKVERQKWEEEEKKYAGGAGAENAVREGWGRWFDRL